MNNDILLEAGTGEVELLEFKVDERYYAINVIKVKEILEQSLDNITKVPQSNSSIAGLLLCRNEVISVIDLKHVLENKYINRDKFMVIICEFNKLKLAFSVDEVVRIHRIKWEQILKPQELTENSFVIGNIILQEKIMLLLDFEKIVTDISPSTGISENRIVDVEYKDRSKNKLVLADDSPLIRRLLKDTLTKAGFTNLKIFDDGKQALIYLNGLYENKDKDFIEEANILITDIEMPVMDGFTLTRKIKEHPVMRKLPVIIFSSLITDDLKHKGISVGANGQLSKPEIGELVEMIDMLLKKIK